MTVIDDMLSKVEPSQRTELERIRQLIKRICPDAKEVMTYGMPGFKYKDKYLISFGAFKDHLSIFPGAELIETLKGKLKPYRLSKGTIQFTHDTPIPDALLTEIIELCVSRIDSKSGGR